MARKNTFFKSLGFIAAAAAFSLIGTLSAEAAYRPGERAMKIWHDDLNPSKHAIFLKFKASVETGDGREENTTTMAVKGHFMYVDVLSDMSRRGVSLDLIDNLTVAEVGMAATDNGGSSAYGA